MPIGTKKNSAVLMLSTPCAYRLHVPPGTVSRVCRPDQCCRRDLVAAAGHTVQVNQDVSSEPRRGGSVCEMRLEFSSAERASVQRDQLNLAQQRGAHAPRAP